MDLLQVNNIVKRNRKEVVLNDISFQYTTFKRIAIAGETGSGKTTLLKVIAGLVQPDAGKVLFEEERIAGPDERLLPGHPRIAYLSQHFELRNNYSVGDFLEMASKVGEKRAYRIYELCQIDHLLQRNTDQLSGGERQRTALARLLTTAPRLLLLDEPFSNLDGLHKQVLKNVLQDIATEENLACMMVSHDPVDVLPWAEEVIVMQEGTIIQTGIPEIVYSQPVSEYAGGLFGDYNILSAEQAMVIFKLGSLPAGKKLFIRPEGIRLIPATGNAAKGPIKAVHFFGSYDVVELRIEDVTLVAKTDHAVFKTGEVVEVAIAGNNICFV